MAGYRIPSDYQNDKPLAVHNWNTSSSGPIHCGLAYVAHHRHLNAKERIRGSIANLIQSEPIQGPLMNGFKLVTIATFTPDSILYGWLRHGKRYSTEEIKTFTRYCFCPYEYWPADGGESFLELIGYGSSALQAGFPLPEVSDVADFSSYLYALWTSDVPLTESPVAGVDLVNRNCHVGRGGLWDWLGVAAGSVPPVVAAFPSAVGPGLLPSWRWRIEPAIAYFLTYYYYILNVQETDAYYSKSAYVLAKELKDSSLAGVRFDELYQKFDPNNFLDAIHDLGNFSYKSPNLPTELAEYMVTYGTSENYSFLRWLLHGAGAHGGLFAVPYSPDFFNNIINIGESPTTTIPVETTPDGDSVAVPQIRLQTKIQNMLDRLFVSGGRPEDIFRTLWGAKSDVNVDKPDFLGVWQTYIDPMNVVSTAVGANGAESSSIGQMAGRVDKFSNFGNRKIDYYASQPGTVIFVTFLVPSASYSQGLHPDLFCDDFIGDFNPELNGIGFQSVPRWRYTMMPNSFEMENNPFLDDGVSRTGSDPNMSVVGDTVAWDWLRTDYPRLHGEFAQNGNMQFWVLARHFTEAYTFEGTPAYDEEIVPVGYELSDNFSTYVNPMAWQYMFVDRSYLKANFTYSFYADLTVTSEVSKNWMPYLGR
ncbi:hypothetical protein [Alistipes sp. An66]|uniref:hypothetical protein n=1 Tax=Alistipes sp. An66 TaxID=1965650 RepID=UPI0011789AC3|nr:hypothetical protein [Alistipes sp. An66]